VADSKRALERKAQRPARSTYETDDADIQELHEAFDYATDAWADIRDAAQVDMRIVGGDTWEPADRQVREDAMRPCSSYDEIGQYINQVINDVRQNKRAIKVTPLGNGANDQSAQLRADLYRQIEYRSNAQQAYTTMFENAVQRSYGYLRWKPRYVSARSRHQELLIEPVMNPDLVTPDPDGLKPDLSDIKFLFLQESWAKAEFKKAFPKAKVQDFTIDLMRQMPRWIRDERIMLAEWWKIRTIQKKLVYLDVPAAQVPGQPPQPAQELDVFEDELAQVRRAHPLATIVGDRLADVPEVSMCLTNGIEILRGTEWKGIYIPFVGCFGKILYLDEGGGPEKRILSAHRLAQPSAQLYSFCRTSQQEQVGLSTKFPYFVRQGSLSPEEARKLEKSLHEPVGFIQVKALGDDFPPGVMPEMPQRNPFEPAIQALEVLAEGARRAIQAGMGISPLPTSAQRRNEKSGVALKQIETSQQKGTFHFVDNLDAALTRCAVIGDDLIPHYYDAARDLTVRKPDDTTTQIRVNDPNMPADAKSSYAAPGQAPMLSGQEQHDYTLSTGPSFDSEREAANDFADVLVQNIATIAQVSGPKAAAKIMGLGIKLKNIGALGDAMAEIISPSDDSDRQLPQLQQENEQLKAAVQQLQQLADDNQAKLLIAKGKDDTAKGIAEIKAIADADNNRADNETRLAVAELGAKVERLTLFLEERARLGVESHEVGSAIMAHEHAKELAGMQHGQAMEQGQIAHEQALEQAAVPPPPMEGGV